MPIAIASYRQEIQIPRPPDRAAEVVAQTRRYCESTGELLAEAEEQVEHRYQRDHVGWFGVAPDHKRPRLFTSVDRVLWIGGFCLVAFESLCAAVLAAMTLAASPLVAAAVGVGITAVLTLTMKAVWYLYVSPDEAQPRRAVATLYRWLLPLFALWAVALVTALLLPRLMNEATTVMEVAFNVAMSVLTVVSPALSGILFTAAALFGWARARSREANELRGLRHKIHTLSQECDRASPQTTATSGSIDSEHHGTSKALKRATTVAVMAFATLIVATPVLAQSRGALWMDDSSSARHEDVKRARDQFFALLPSAVNDGVGAWEFFRFTRDALNATPVAAFDVPPFAPPGCDDLLAASELTTLFRRPKNAARRQAEQRCADRRATARAEYDTALAGRIAMVRDTLDAKPKATGPCTGLVDLLSRLVNQPSTRSSIVVIISDGIESCVPTAGLQLLPPPPTVRVLMAAVPSTTGGRSPWQEFETRRNTWRRVAPWMEVVPLSQLTRDTFTRKGLRP